MARKMRTRERGAGRHRRRGQTVPPALRAVLQSRLVDGFNVPAGSSTYEYIDVFGQAGLGSITVNDANADRAAGAEWDVTGTILAQAAPDTGRVLYGNVESADQ